MTNPDLGSATVKSINEQLGTQTATEPLETFMRHRIWFDGYVAAVDATRVVGRWLAMNPETRRLTGSGIVSICGGSVQEIEQGQPFDIGGVWTQLDDDIERLRVLKEQAYVDLKKFIASKYMYAAN